MGVTSGRYNTMVLDDAGQLFVWGYDGCADGVVPEQTSAWKARRIKGELEGQKVVAFDAGESMGTGCGDSHSLGHHDRAMQKRKVKHCVTLRPPPFSSGYTLWIAATSTGTVYTCNHQVGSCGGVTRFGVV